jgi:DMSO/TMAO reductase YedYZ molybdopterin-dependent catalytic subunit
MEIPLDGNGEITLFVFAFGFSPYKIITIPEVLEPGEIREYEGQPLSSINDFRENSIQGPQYIDKESYELSVTGLVEAPMTYSYDSIVENLDHHLKVLTLNCVEGWSVKLLWEGVLVRNVIEEAGVLDDAKVIIFHAYDGYSTSFPIDYIIENDILLAHKMNNVTLPPERGFPFELVAEGKWGFKWIKWITTIELSDDEEYRGFWESLGYSNSGDQCGQGGLAGRPPGHPSQLDCCICHAPFL